MIMTVWNFNTRIAFVINRVKSLFDHLIVLDTGSTDGSVETLKELEREGIIELYHYVMDRGAGRDSNFLLRKADIHRPKWIVKLDHDEYYEDALYDELNTIRTLPLKYGWVSSPRVTLWKHTGKYRVDGRYRLFRENTMFRWREGLLYPQDAVHHMDRIPEPMSGLKRFTTRARLIHLSQVDEERMQLQIERLKEFDRDWSHRFDPAKIRLHRFREKKRRG